MDLGADGNYTPLKWVQDNGITYYKKEKPYNL